MQTRVLGDAGPAVSVLGLGCNAFGHRISEQQATTVIQAALDHGVTFFDTADIYGFGASEEIVGRALGRRRDDVVLATKFGMDMEGKTGLPQDSRGSRSYVRAAVDDSLRRLGTDWIDLYQFHQPDPQVPIAETLQALAELVDEGKIRSYGLSNTHSWELADAVWTARTAGLPLPVTVQNEYSLLNRAAELALLPAAQEYGVSLLPYFPLAYGLLTGKYQPDVAPASDTRLAAQNQRHRYDNADFAALGELESLAARYDVQLIDLGIAGLLVRACVGSVIAGATRPEQVAANAKAALMELPDDLLNAVERICPPRASGHASYHLPVDRPRRFRDRAQ